LWLNGSQPCIVLAVHGEDQAEPVKVIFGDLACALVGNVDVAHERCLDRARVGRTAFVPATGAGAVDGNIGKP